MPPDDVAFSTNTALLVPPHEVARHTKDYRTDPEIILGCILVSGTFDTSEVLRAEVGLNWDIAISDDEKAAHIAFRRVWARPTNEEREAVLELAERIAEISNPAFLHLPFMWNGLAS